MAYFSREELDSFRESTRQVNPYSGIQQAANPQPDKKKKNFWLDQISTVGGIGGGILGSLVAPIAGTAAGAGIGSALGETLENALTGDSLAKNVAKEGALGAVFGAGPMKLLKGGAALAAGKGLQGASQAAQTPLRQLATRGIASKVGSTVTDQASANFFKLTPQQTARLLDEGIDPTRLAQRAAQFGTSAKDIIGKTGKGGPLQATIKALEDGIQQTAKTAGKNVRIPGDELIKALKGHARQIKSEIGGGARLKSINQIIADAEKKYANGVTVQQARNILREANQKFGASVLDDTGDAVVRAAQKLEGNTMRDALKTRFPGIAKALDDEAELIQTREILSRVRGIEKAAKGGVGKFDLTRPGSFVDPILKSNQVTSRVLRSGSGASDEVARAAGRPSMAGIGARQVGQNLFIPRQEPQGLEDALVDPQSPLGNVSDITTAATSPTTNNTANAFNMGEQYQNEAGMSSPYSRENLMADVQRDPENADNYFKLYQMYQEVFAPPEADQDTLTQGQQERADLIRALDNTEGLMAGGSINYGPIGSRVEGIKSMFNAADPETLAFKNTVSGLRAAITKARAGASLTPGELKMLAQYTPSDTDSEQVVRSKLSQLRALYGYQAPQGGGASLEDALLQMQPQ